MDEILRQAELQNFKTAWQLTAEMSDRGETCIESGFLLTSCGMTFTDYNLAFPLDHVQTSAGKVRKISRWFEQRQLPFYIVHTSTTSNESKGLDGKQLIAMLHHQPASSPRAFPEWEPSAMPVSDRHSLECFHRVIAEAFQLPLILAQRLLTKELADNDSVELWLATLNDQPVATSMIAFTHNMAGLYWLAVSDEFRHKGYGKAILRHCLAHISERGIQYTCLQTPEALSGFYHELGFRPICCHSLQRIAA